MINLKGKKFIQIETIRGANLTYARREDGDWYGKGDKVGLDDADIASIVERQVRNGGKVITQF